MEYGNYFLETYDSYKEFTVYDFKKQISSYTKKFRSIRDKIRGKEPNLATVVDVKRKGKDLDIYFLTVPTYSDNELEVIGVSGRMRQTNAYQIVIRIVDFFNWGNIPYNKITADKINEILKVADVKFWNSSPAFLWQGYAYQLTQINSSIKPVKIPDTIWGKKTGNSIIDKHIAGIVDNIASFTGQISKQIKIKVKKHKTYGKI